MTDSLDADQFQVEVTARALIIKDDHLLLVSNDGKIWYLPGGRLEPSESLQDCVAREVYEETGLLVVAGDLLHVFEYLEVEYRRHKVECCFLARLEAGELSGGWADIDGPVSHIKFFQQAEMEGALVYPEFLRTGAWRAHVRSSGHVYVGLER